MPQSSQPPEAGTARAQGPAALRPQPRHGRPRRQPPPWPRAWQQEEEEAATRKERELGWDTQPPSLLLLPLRGRPAGRSGSAGGAAAPLGGASAPGRVQHPESPTARRENREKLSKALLNQVFCGRLIRGLVLQVFYVLGADRVVHFTK